MISGSKFGDFISRWRNNNAGLSSFMHETVSDVDRGFSEALASEVYSGALAGAWSGVKSGAMSSIPTVLATGNPLAALANIAPQAYIGGILGAQGAMVKDAASQLGLTGSWASAGSKTLGVMSRLQSTLSKASALLPDFEMPDVISGVFDHEVFSSPLGKSPAMGLLGGIIGDSLGDALDAREFESYRDMMEDYGMEASFAADFIGNKSYADMQAKNLASIGHDLPSSLTGDSGSLSGVNPGNIASYGDTPSISDFGRWTSGDFTPETTNFFNGKIDTGFVSPLKLADLSWGTAATENPRTNFWSDASGTHLDQNAKDYLGDSKNTQQVQQNFSDIGGAVGGALSDAGDAIGGFLGDVGDTIGGWFGGDDNDNDNDGDGGVRV
jgi:hypothetical protein